MPELIVQEFDKTTYHLWGVRYQWSLSNDGMCAVYHKNTWEYIKEAGSNRRCLHGVDKRNWSQLEIRDCYGKVFDRIDTLNDD